MIERPTYHSVPPVLITVCLIALGVPSEAYASNDAVRWNSALLQAIRNTAFPPVHAARAFAIVHTCMYDAWAAYDDVAVGTRAGAALRRPDRERTLANQRQALSYAAYQALVDLFPTERRLADAEMGRLGYDPRDISSVAAGVGTNAGDAVLAFRHRDGSNQLGDLNGGEPYSDYTGYSPVNDVDRVSDPNRWQPLRASLKMMPGLLASRWISDGEPHVFLAPHWGLGDAVRVGVS